MGTAIKGLTMRKVASMNRKLKLLTNKILKAIPKRNQLKEGGIFSKG